MERQEKYARKHIYDYIRQLVNTAKYRGYPPRSSHYRPKYDSMTVYEKAKKAQTEQRNLQKALSLYVQSANKGEKLDSSIKDFASVLHQLGFTELAVNFLGDIRQYYQGDIKKFDRLKQNLQNQLKPSVKHECKNILIEFPQMRQINQELIAQMFENAQRIKRFLVFNDLSFQKSEATSVGKYLLLEFDSFSAAKKTLDKFKFSEWFGVNKYWVKGVEIVCEAHDGRIDFEKGLQLSNLAVRDIILSDFQNENQLNFPRNLNWINKGELTNYLNALSIKMIQDHMSKLQNESLKTELD